MRQHAGHIPAPPRSPEPPRGLRKLARELTHPDVMNVGLTTTNEGEWAVRIRVRPGASIPLSGIGSRCRGFPVIYEVGSTTPPVARPAFPGEEPDPDR